MAPKLVRPAASMTFSPVGPIDHRPASPLPPDGPCLTSGAWVADRYLAIRRLGQGGMGTVWEVEHAHLRRRFALKHLRKRADASMLARFHREATAAAALDHPNVVRVFDYDADRTIGPFVVMELLLGSTLAESIDGAMPLTLRETVRWLEPVARALDALHERGLVHRDVKPENIVESEIGPEPVVKLVDFGLAAHVDGRDRITREGTLLGTPHYMAPEVTEGDPASPASDVYSLAVVAFELLTGGLPHDGLTTHDIVCSKLTTPPPTLAESSGRMFSVALEDTFAAALSYQPSQRPARASELVARLTSQLRR